MVSVTRDGVRVETYDGQGRILDLLYGSALGRILLRLLIRPWLSRLAGRLLDRPFSQGLIPRFIRKNNIDLTDYPDRDWPTFNAFFCRRIDPAARPIDPDPNHLVAPCDGKLTFCPIDRQTVLTVKGVDYTVEDLFRDAALAERYAGGVLLLFRLTVDDYHRFSWPCAGTASRPVHIPGFFHTVNPRAAERRPIYRENTREYTVLHSPVFGEVLQMEVGAMLVGRIVNDFSPGAVHSGEEKGRFEFGGSSILLCLPPDSVLIDDDIIRNSRAGLETIVRMGEKIGIRK